MRKKLSTCLIALAAMLTFSPQKTWAQVNEYFYIRSSYALTVNFTGSPNVDLWYSTNKSNWTKITETKQFPSTSNTTYYFKGNNPNGFSKDADNYVSFLCTSKSQYYTVAGNVMSLVNANDFTTNYSTIPNDYCFYCLFTNITDAYAQNARITGNLYARNLSLPANNLKRYCYAYMFHRTDITECMTILPAQNLADYCYYKMFYNTSSLNIPETYKLILAAEELAPHCYEYMFGIYNDIPNLTQYIEIMATSLKDSQGNNVENAMAYMFSHTAGGQVDKNLTWRITLHFSVWGDTSVETCPTYLWFYGTRNFGRNYFTIPTTLTDRTKSKLNKNGYVDVTSDRNHFPYNAYLTDATDTYLTFDVKTNGGTWASGSDYDEDKLRVVRAGYPAKSIPADPVKSGLRFLGWYTAPSGGTEVETSTILSQTTAQTYYAQFAALDINYDVTITTPVEGLDIAVTKKGGGAVNSGDKVEDGTILVFTATENNVHFNEWKVNNTALTSSTNPMEYTVNGEDITLTATSKVRCTFTADPKAGGTVTTNQNSVSPCDVNYAVNVTFSATNNPGYHFVNWTMNDVEKTTETSFTESVKADVNYVAHFAPNDNTSYTVKHYQQNLDGTYPAEPTEIENLTGTTDTEVTPAVKNYTGFTSPTPQKVTIKGDGTAVVEYKYEREKYTLTIDACTGGTYTVKIGNAGASAATDGETIENNILYGTKVTLEAVNTEHFTFTGWQLKGGTITTNNSIIFTMAEDVEYQAIFESSLVSHTLTLYPTMSAGSTGIIKVTGNNETFTSPTDSEYPVKCTIYEGVEYTCELISNDDNSWGWWLEGDFPISSEQEMTIIPTADVELHAGFGLKHVELDGTNSAKFYETYENNMIHELVYLRTFSAKTWSTMWMPFSFDVTQQGLSGKVYTLSKTAIEAQAEGIVDVALTFHKYASGVIGGGELFIFYTPTEIKDFVFSDVLMDTFEPKDKLYGDDATTHSGVHFLGTENRRKVGGEGSEALQKSYRYIKGNVLYYPALNKGIMANTFLGYFQMKDYEYWYGGGSSAAPRMRIIVDDETVITEAETDNEVETRKYINDEGYLIIERNGKKYTANGAVLE